jgi:hypothetical protein
VSVALRGNLEDFGIADVFQLIGQQRKTGLLELRSEAGHVELRFDRGAVVSAAPVRGGPHEALGEMLVRCGLLDAERLAELRGESEASAWSAPVLAVERGWLDAGTLEQIEDLLTRETLFAILRWRSGAFDFRAQPVEHARAVEALHGAEQILMDGLRMLDEWQSFAGHVPSEALVFERSGDLERWRAEAGAAALPAAVIERVYGLVDGRANVREVIDRSRLGTFDAVRALAELRRTGVIATAERAAAPAAARERAPRRRTGVARAAFATAFPLLLLALAAASALRAPPGPSLPGFPIERRPWDSARADHAARGLRHAVASERFATGRWPSALPSGARAPSAMAGAQGRPYYYALRDEGAVLLAPER